MEPIKNIADLKSAIQELEDKHATEKKILKVQFSKTMEGLKPINILKNTLREMVESSDIKQDITSILIGLTTGFLAKKLVVGATHNPFTKLAGTVIEMLVSKSAIKNADDIKTFGSTLFNNLFNPESSPAETEHE